MNSKYNQIKMQFPLKSDEAIKLPFYVVNIGSMEKQHPCYRANGLSEYQFLFCSAGEGYLVIDNQEYLITAGMGMYFRPGVAHDYYAKKEPWTTHWIMFNGSAVDAIPSIQNLDPFSIFYVYNMDKLTLLHNKIYSTAEHNSLLNINDVSLLLYQFLLEIGSCVGNSPRDKHRSRSKQLIHVIHHIESHFSQDITLDELASIAAITPQHLCRLFKATYHMRPIEYLLSYRLNYAKQLLTSEKNLTLKEISTAVGFHDLSYFCAMFKKAEGMTPIEFKKLH